MGTEPCYPLGLGHMYASDRCPHVEREPTPVQMALARGHRWVAMLESGVVKLLPELARRAGCTAAT